MTPNICVTLSGNFIIKKSRRKIKKYIKCGHNIMTCTKNSNNSLKICHLSKFQHNYLFSLLHEKAETFFWHTESTFFVRHSSEYETVLSVCEKNVSAFSCNSEVLQYQQIIHITIKAVSTYFVWEN